jgi:PAS domain S-box-containing protein
MKLGDVDLRWLERYKAPAVLLLVLACMAVVMFRDSVGVSAVSYIHIFYFPAIIAGLWYGRRAAWLAIVLALVEMYLNYQIMGTVTPLMVFDGAALVVITVIIGVLMENANKLNARLKDSDRLLQSSEASYRAIFDAASDGIVLFDPAAGRLLDANEAWVQLTGYRIDETATLTFSMLNAEEESLTRQEIMVYVTAALRGDSQFFQRKVRRKDGGVFWAEISLKRIVLNEKDLLLAVIRDITGRKRAEEALRESEERFKAVFDRAAVGIAITEPGGHIADCNPVFQAMLGYGKEELRQLTFYDYTHPDDVDRNRELQRRLAAGEIDHYQIIKRYTRKDGQPFWCKINASAIRDGDGTLKYNMGVAEDITERMRAEEALRESEAQFRALAESTASAIVILQDGRVKYANPATEKLVGYTADEITAMNPIEAASVIDPASILHLNLVRFRRKAYEGYHRYEIRLKSRDGRRRWVDVTTGVINFGGRPAFLATGFDITERRQAEEQLRASLREKEVLLKEVHHRVKNNLQVVSSMLSLQSMNATDPTMMRMLQESQDRVRSMALIHEKLYKSGDLAHINFEEYARNLTAYLVRSYSGQGQPIDLRLDISDIPFSIDLAIPCGLIINELVSNALKYAFPEGRAGTITVSIRQDSGSYRLIVGDDGVGMPAHVDYRNHSSLGLQLVNTLVGQLEGTITMSAEKGTAFTIQFPAEP